MDRIVYFLLMEQVMQEKHTLFRVGCVIFSLTCSGYKPVHNLDVFLDVVFVIIEFCL
jgi:hypothetical protein